MFDQLVNIYLLALWHMFENMKMLFDSGSGRWCLLHNDTNTEDELWIGQFVYDGQHYANNDI